MTWKLVPLKQITTKIGSGATPRGGNNSYKTEGITLIRSLNVHDLEFRYEGLAFINEEQASDARLARANIEPKDILLNITGASVARCCIVPEHLLPARVNQHVSLVRVDPNLADSHYVLYCINSPVYKRQLLTLAQGGATREALTQEIIGNLEIPLPPIPIQHKIADFLERKTQQINELIRIKEKQIELLKEQRTVLINQAVTKGIDPNVEMKPSGVEWIGEIPKHWTVTRLKYISNIPVTYGLNIESDRYTTEGFRLIRITDIDESGKLRQKGVYLPEDCVSQEQILNRYDLLLSRSGTVGKSYLHLEDGKYTSAGYLVRFNFGDYYTSKFIYYVTLSHFYRNWLEQQAIISTIQNVNGKKYSNFQIPIPSHQEQTQIVNFLDCKTERIDALIATEQRKIELLKEYRQSLISEAVTGKIDVRNEV